MTTPNDEPGSDLSVHRFVYDGHAIPPRRVPRGLRYGFVLPALVLYGIACCLPAASQPFIDSDSVIQGGGALCCGLLWGGRDAIIPWTANVFAFASLFWLLKSRPECGWVCAAVALLLASRVFLPIPGTKFLEAKYWWLASMAVLLIGCIASTVWLIATAPLADDIHE